MTIDLCQDAARLLEDFCELATGERSERVADAMCYDYDALFWRALLLEKAIHENDLGCYAVKTKAIIDSIDVSTRGKRRKAAALVVKLTGKIHDAEMRYLDRIPENLRSCEAYADAENSVEMLSDAIAALLDAY